MSRRTEMAYKAQSPGKLAQHNKAPGSGDRVNAAVVQPQFTSLSREICLTSGLSTAPDMVTGRGIRQKSAEVIVGADADAVARRLETSRGGIDAEASPHRRTEHRAGRQTQ